VSDHHSRTAPAAPASTGRAGQSASGEFKKPQAVGQQLHGFQVSDADAWHAFVAVGHGEKSLRQLLSGRIGWRDAGEPKTATEMAAKQVQLMWCSRKRDLRQVWDIIPPWLLVNHFPSSGCLNSKSGMLQLLRQHCGRRSGAGDGRPPARPLHEIMPRSYDLRTPGELAAFIADFAITRAAGVLQTALNKDVCSRSAVAATAVRLLDRLLKSRGATLGGRGVMTLEEPLISADEVSLVLGPPPSSKADFQVKASPAAGGVCQFKDFGSPPSEPEEKADDQIESTDGAARRLLTQMDGIPQLQNCMGIENCLWVLKAPHLNCGRGVQIHSELAPMLEDSKKEGWRMVAQRYLEDALLISGGRKCDLRVWVVVSSWNPAVVWIHPEPYFRLASKPLTLDQSGIKDLFMHLTNRSVQKKEDPNGNAPEYKSAESDEDHIMLLDAFFDWAEQNLSEVEFPNEAGAGSGESFKSGSAREAWEQCTWPRILNSVRTAVVACQGDVGMHPPGCFELFGFDFMLDTKMRPWLLEANSSPDLCEDAGPALRSLVEGALGDLLSMVIGLQDGSLNLPKCDGRIWSRDEHVAGSGKWRLCLQEATLPPSRLNTPGTGWSDKQRAAVAQRLVNTATAVAPPVAFTSIPGKETHPKVLRACFAEPPPSQKGFADAIETLVRPAGRNAAEAFDPTSPPRSVQLPGASPYLQQQLPVIAPDYFISLYHFDTRNSGALSISGGTAAQHRGGSTASAMRRLDLSRGRTQRCCPDVQHVLFGSNSGTSLEVSGLAGEASYLSSTDKQAVRALGRRVTPAPMRSTRRSGRTCTDGLQVFGSAAAVRPTPCTVAAPFSEPDTLSKLVASNRRRTRQSDVW